MMGVENTNQEILFDPRTKLIILLICILAAATAPSLLYELGLVFIIGVFGCINKRIRSSISWFLCYGVIYFLTMWILKYTGGSLRTTLMASLGLFHKVYPCGMLSGIMLSTTKVSEFLSAMNKIKVPNKVVIPLAVMLRYIPAIREDWGFIKDAMRLRNVVPSLKGLITSPGMTMECVYVPLMMAASKAADELSIAALTRGIENPEPRTCLFQIHFRFRDWIAAACFLVYFIAGHLH